MTEPSDGDTRLLWGSVAGALVLHALLAFGGSGVHGGADLLPHSWLIREMSESPAIRSVYAPAYHAIGGLLSPWMGFEAFTRAFAFVAAGALIAGFRSFQRAAKLPDAATALFAWSPYAFALTWCVPKVEAAGYAVAFWGLGCLLARRHVALGLAVAATFAVHTAAGLFLGLGGGLLALARRDLRSFSALAAGAVLASPLFAAHLVAGCSLAQSFLLSGGDYLRRAGAADSLERWDQILVLAGPIGLAAAAVGVPLLWRLDRSLAFLCALVVALYSNELWLAPFGSGTTLNLLRGLTLLAFATAICGGVALATRPRVATLVLCSCAVWATCAAVWIVPQSCFVRSFDEAETDSIRVDRCTFRWRKLDAQPPAGGAGTPPADRSTR